MAITWNRKQFGCFTSHKPRYKHQPDTVDLSQKSYSLVYTTITLVCKATYKYQKKRSFVLIFISVLFPNSETRFQNRSSKVYVVIEKFWSGPLIRGSVGMSSRHCCLLYLYSLQAPPAGPFSRKSRRKCCDRGSMLLSMGLKIKHIMEGNGSGNDLQACLVGLKCIHKQAALRKIFTDKSRNSN